MKCYGLGLGLDTFRMVALDANFRKLEESQVAATYNRWAPRTSRTYHAARVVKSCGPQFEVQARLCPLRLSPVIITCYYLELVGSAGLDQA